MTRPRQMTTARQASQAEPIASRSNLSPESGSKTPKMGRSLATGFESGRRANHELPDM